jgi:hypothetical protein
VRGLPCWARFSLFVGKRVRKRTRKIELPTTPREAKERAEKSCLTVSSDEENRNRRDGRRRLIGKREAGSAR